MQNFEKKLSNYFGPCYSVALSNGTAALHLAIKSLQFKKNDTILTSPLTFIATASSILMNSLKPEFSDIDKDTYTLDPNLVEDRLKKNKKIKAVIAVDFAGHPCDWESFYYLKKKYNIKLINDNCHSLGSKYLGKKNYAVNYADIVTQSYHAVKNFTTGEGGAVLTKNIKIYNYIKSQRSHGIIKNNETRKKGTWYYSVKEFGYNYRITDFQSALGASQLRELDKFVNKRKMLAMKYDNFFENHFDIFKIPKIDKKKYFHSYHLYPIQINFKKLRVNKKLFFEKMFKQGVNLQVHYIPLYKQPFLAKHVDIKNLRNTENFYQNEVSLPIYYKLTFEEQTFLINKIYKSLNL